MKFSFVFGFILLILLIIGVFVGLPYALEMIKSGSFKLPISLPFSLPKIRTPFNSNYFLSPTQTGSPTALPPKTGESPYKEMVSIGNFYFSGAGQISLRASYFSKEITNITGWKIKSAKKGETVIGKAVNLPELDSAPSDILLSGGDSVDIIMGPSPLGKNFRVNNCFGWLRDIYNFSYSLDYCPGRFKVEELTDLDSSCTDLILRTSACKAPNEDTLNNQSGKCRDWVLKNMNYNSCVIKHRNDSDFFRGWRVYTGNGNKIVDPLHDKIELRDQASLLVDSYEY